MRGFNYISNNNWSLLILAGLISLLAGGCTGLGKIQKGQHLFTGADIHYDSVHLLSDKSKANSQLEGLIKSPNAKFLWMRPFLSIHNMVGETKKEKGLKYWLKYRLGQPPVLLEEMKPARINDAMVNRLVNMGHFQAESGYDVHRKKKTATLEFDVSPGRAYYIKKVSFPQGDSGLIGRIRQTKSKTLLKAGQHYDLEEIKNERSRIDSYLKDHGYFYFSQDYLKFLADSTVGNRKVTLSLQVKDETPQVAETAFTLNKIYVFDDFSLENYHPDTMLINGYYYISDKHRIKPKTILESVFLDVDSLYSRHDHYNTLSYLMGLGVYKFANARFNIIDTLGGRMKAGIYLTPQKRMSVRAEVGGAVKTNNFAGPALSLNFKNRNTFRGAELLSVSLGSRFETQYSGQYKGETSYEITLDGSLTFPRFVPFRFNNNLSRQYVPKTTIDVGTGLYSRIRYYQLESFNVSLGYNWRSSKRITQDFRPIDVSFTNLSKTSQEFQDYLDQNPTIKRSFDEQFIVGARYTFTYSTLQSQNGSGTGFLISPGVDVAGNVTSLIASLTQGSSPSPEKQQKLLNVPYSQFARLRNEIRYFFRLGKNDLVGMRLITGAAVPYGNSSTVPYVRQFFVGGTNSIRAFRARTVGPGTYSPPDTVSTLYLDQAGDIKLEYSLEYRFPIRGFLKGALFADAGNIWLVNEDPQRPGGIFNFNTFYKELAVGGGAGLRFDFSFVVLRLDIAFPWRKPYLPAGQRWVLDKIKLGSKSWRKENLIFNIAIGYPF